MLLQIGRERGGRYRIEVLLQIEAFCLHGSHCCNAAARRDPHPASANSPLKAGVTPTPLLLPTIRQSNLRRL